MTKALVLDFGGVISRTLFETHDLTEQALGLAAGTLDWRGPFDPVGDTLWQSMQNDDISERDYWHQRTREVATMTGQNWTQMSQFVVAARGADPMPVIRPEALHAIDRAYEAGCTLAILSNELDLLYGRDFRGNLPFLSKFSIIHDATYTGILKPDRRAYLACVNALECEPADCIFVDDQLRNIRGAQAIGMKTVHFDVAKPGPSYAAALALLDLKGENP